MLAILAGLLLACMVLFPAAAAGAALHGFKIWATSVLPALFPYLVCCQLLAATGAPLTLLALLGGSPTGAKLIALRRASGGLSRARAERLACLTGTVSPMFLLSTLPLWMDAPRAGWPLLLAHWGGALLTGGLFAPFLRDEAQGAKKAAPIVKPSARPVRLSFGEAVTGAAQASLAVGGCIAVCTVAAKLLPCALPGLGALPAAILHAALEMAGGSAALASLGFPARATLMAMAATASFSGLSILAQNLTFLSPVGVRGWVLICARLVHAALAAGLIWLFC